jgi:DNA-binding transcriptional ArsR family regulator
MSAGSPAAVARRLRVHAPIFAALGDETRLALVALLGTGTAQSISHLTAHSDLTRQAITKHLRVLEDAGIVRNVRHGRESLFALAPEPLARAQECLELVSAQWDEALGRLKAFVERSPSRR